VVADPVLDEVVERCRCRHHARKNEG